MNDPMIYRPYKGQTGLIFFTIPCGIFFFVMVGCCLTISIANALLFAGMGIACIWITKEVYDDSKKAVYLDEKGIRLFGGSDLEYREIPWEELTHAYYGRSYKGNLFMILSSGAMSLKEKRQFANRGANSGRMYIDGVVVIRIRRDASQVREFAENHAAQVDRTEYSGGWMN